MWNTLLQAIRQYLACAELLSNPIFFCVHMAASSHTTSPPATPSRSSPRFQQASEKQSSDNDDDQEEEKRGRRLRTKAPIATRTRHALNHSAPSSHQTGDNKKVHSRKPSDDVADGETGSTRRTDEDEDMAKILASLPARKRAKLAAAR